MGRSACCCDKFHDGLDDAVDNILGDFCKPKRKPTIIFTPTPNAPSTPSFPTPGTPRTCKSVIPPWKGHHGGISACFDGRGNLTAFVEHPERPQVYDPF